MSQDHLPAAKPPATQWWTQDQPGWAQLDTARQWCQFCRVTHWKYGCLGLRVLWLRQCLICLWGTCWAVHGCKRVIHQNQWSRLQPMIRNDNLQSPWQQSEMLNFPLSTMLFFPSPHSYRRSMLWLMCASYFTMLCMDRSFPSPLPCPNAVVRKTDKGEKNPLTFAQRRIYSLHMYGIWPAYPMS